MRISPCCHSLWALMQSKSSAQRAVLCNSDRYRKRKHRYPNILSIPLTNSCSFTDHRAGNAFVDSDSLSPTSPSAHLWVFTSNKMLNKIKAFLLMWSLLLSTCSPLTVQRPGGITTNGFLASLPLAISHNSAKWLWQYEILQWCGWGLLLQRDNTYITSLWHNATSFPRVTYSKCIIGQSTSLLQLKGSLV